MNYQLLPLALGLAACATTASTPVVPRLDAHQHLVSPAFAPIVGLPERDGAALVGELDAAGIERAIVLSVAYSFADERKGLPDPDGLSRRENDWTSAQVAAHPTRLTGFCSANPLRDAALQEMERCLALPGMVGIKLHFGNSGVSLRKPEHRARIREVALLAERNRAPVLIHMRARGGQDYGAQDARLFLDEIVPAAPNVDIIVAHLAYAGPGYSPEDSAMAEFAQRLATARPAWRRVWFDVATDVVGDTTPEVAGQIADRLRAVGLGRILYGSDLTAPGGSIGEGWAIFRRRMPLTEAEFRRITSNEPRSLR
ncbi:amidohydrolase family protein [Tsuneonella sp. HG222]